MAATAAPLSTRIQKNSITHGTKTIPHRKEFKMFFESPIDQT